MRTLTPVVRNLLIANILVYLAQVNLQLVPSVTQLGSLHGFASPDFRVWQFVTYMFLHDPHDIQHIFFNMFGLLSFGPLLEQRWGGQRFLTFWLLCGVGAGVLYQGVRTLETQRLTTAYTEFRQAPGPDRYDQFMRRSSEREAVDGQLAQTAAANPNDAVVKQAMAQRVEQVYARAVAEGSVGMLGASGALFGVLFAFAYLFPNTILQLIFPPISLKAKYFVLLYGVFELGAGLYHARGDTVAHFAHIGGLLIGFIVIKFWERGRRSFY